MNLERLHGRSIQRLRYEREHAEIRREMERLQEQGGSQGDAAITALWQRKKDLYTKSRH